MIIDEETLQLIKDKLTLQALDDDKYANEVMRRSGINLSESKDEEIRELTHKYPFEMHILLEEFRKFQKVLMDSNFRFSDLLKILPESLQLFFIGEILSTYKAFASKLELEYELMTGKFKFEE